MPLPIPADLEPMLALIQPDLPAGDGWEYEPKWDGLRVLAYVDGDQVRLESRGAREMTRYFPELLPGFRRLPSKRLVLDGEVILIGPDGLDFDALLQRVHPADSRVRMLAEKTPVSYVAFDLLAIGNEDLRERPLRERRERLEKELAGVDPPLHMTPFTRDVEVARRWLAEFEGAGLDGVIAKTWDQPYIAGKRGWVKIKHGRTADCVVIGYRVAKDGNGIGALLLGLYDDKQTLHYVGHTSSFDAATRRRLLEELQPLRGESGVPMGRMPGGPSRWSRGRETEHVSLRPELVCEVSFDKLQSGWRFRHATGFKRWRPDKPPEQCRFDQIDLVARYDVAEIFATRG
ncbi:MAG: ATP-dependent DNA ligase [Chloroflexi bacterium]|nr:MAG: ATP-dependent DNA ligase [Chloroflexota bacterium]